jgi:phosphoadenosine phosphosulfate reductase
MTTGRQIAGKAGVELADASAHEVLTWAFDTFGDRLVVAANMRDAVLVHLAAEVRPGVPVLFLDTGYHFAETIGTRDAVAAGYDIQLINAHPATTVVEQDRIEGKDLFASRPDRCCALRKVAPLRAVLRDYDGWVTGVRRVETPDRENTPKVGWDERNGLVKINPIAAWSDTEFDDFVAEHNILVNPLVDAGYPSIGCAPCTSLPLPGADPRSGRWAGRGKTECGLHT